MGCGCHNNENVRRKRIGNDLRFNWTILDGETPYDLEGKDLTLAVRSPLGVMPYGDLQVSGNVISFTLYGKDQKVHGLYQAVLQENAGEIGMKTVDITDIVMLVPHTKDEGGEDRCSHLSIETIDLTSQMIAGVPGKSAYESWLATGHTGSEEDFVNWLKADITRENIESALDLEEGKNLSTNDYTDQDKNKLEEIENGAQANVIERIKRNGVALPPIDKEVNITVPTSLSNLSDDESHRTVTDTEKEAWSGKQNDISEIIPQEASSSNKLADKNYVNDAVTTASADFKGTFESVAELPATGMDKNDYAYVVSSDAAGNTVYNRYKYNGSAWVFEYSISSPTFSSSEWATIRSGMTEELRRKLERIPSDAEANVQPDWNQDNSSADDFIKNKPTIPAVPAISTNVETDGTSDTKTSSPKSVKTFVEGKGYYTKPDTGIPASDIADDVIPDISGLATETELGQLEADFAEFKGGSMDVTDTLVFEQGGIATADGSNQSSQQQIRSNFIPAKSVTVSVTNGSVYVYGWADNTYKGAQGWKTGNDNTVEITGANKYKVVFKKTSGNLGPSGFSDLGATVVANYSADMVKVTAQSLTDAEKQQARQNIDALPTSAEDSIKAYSDAALLLNANKIVGKGETVVSADLVLMPKSYYKMAIPNPSWEYSGSQTKLQLKATGGNQVFNYVGQTEVPGIIYFRTGDYTNYTLYVRANTDVAFTYVIENVAEVDRQIVMGAKPYITPSRIEGGWRIAINPSTTFHFNWEQIYQTPAAATFDFTDTDKLLVFNAIANEYALRVSSLQHGDTVLLDYRAGSQMFVGGLFFPYFLQYGNLYYPEYATASGFDIDENGKVSWTSLSLHKSDNTVETFTADSFVISASVPVLVFRNATGLVANTAFANIDAKDRILLALYDGTYFGMLAYLVEKKKLTSWYGDEYELNIKRLGDQLKNVKWTPKADVRSNEGLNEAGVEVTGVPYSSVKEELKFVGIDVSLHTFMTAINDIHSLMYTENVSANNSQSAYGKTYHGVNSICYFGSVCSGFVTTAIGGIVQFNSWEYQTYPERFHIIEEQDEQNLKVGDIISEPGHCAIVTRLYRTLAGKITNIEVSEHGAPLRTTTYHLQSLIERRLQTGIVYCRMNNRSWIDKYVVYTPSPFVLADGEMLYTGGDFVYRDGTTRTYYRCTQANRDSSFVSAKWQSVPVFATGSQISVNNYRQYGERLYRCKVTHTPDSFDPDKWEYVRGVKEWASYPYTYNDDIVTFAGDRAAFRLGQDIYINFVKGSYTTMQVYKEGTLLDELTLGDGYQLDITSLIATPGLYKARLTDGANYSRYTYFEVIDATVTASIENGVATVNYSSNYGTPIDAQIVELSGFPICHFAVDGGNIIKIDPQAGLYRQRHHYYGRYASYSETVYTRVVFAGEYGNIPSEMVSIGALNPITGILVYPSETMDLGTLSGANNIILTDGLVGKRYDFTFVAASGSSIALRSVLGTLKWAESAPTLQNGKTYIFSVVNGIVRYEEI